ncbi:MAG TPA: Gfo/Idh/MocA family oxidoreductase [Gemmatimonadales bacterium]|nr:Gfo/Idh/MocA family oxidoreductase [Gemmatimonadales bacterium]
MRVGIIGCGLAGLKRARALGGARLVACADAAAERAEALAGATPGQAEVLPEWRAVVERPDIDLVIVATPHHLLAEITLAAVSAGKHVLVEKPAARKARELDPVLEAVKRGRVLVRVGFNHRYHPALRRAKELSSEGAIGELMYVRGRYGHGGRIGYEKEWRAQPDLAGGGELLDQGVHLIDLARWFLGDFESVQGFARTYFWNMPVEDNGFMLLQTAARQAAFLHASCTEWKNQFSYEIFGRLGKLEITGLGGSYGTERLAYYRMGPRMGPPETTIWEYPMADDSWGAEFAEFAEDIRLGRQPSAGLADARSALGVVERIYEASGR